MQSNSGLGLIIGGQNHRTMYHNTDVGFTRRAYVVGRDTAALMGDGFLSDLGA